MLLEGTVFLLTMASWMAVAYMVGALVRGDLMSLLVKIRLVVDAVIWLWALREIARAF